MCSSDLAPLGTRVKRYIDRLGVYNFSFSDMDELYARVNRDFGMFKGIEDEVDIVFANNPSNQKNFLNQLRAVAEYASLKTRLHKEIEKTER